jgi:hypothetical protein
MTEMTLFDYIVYPGIHSRLSDCKKKKLVKVSASGRSRDNLATSRRLVYTSLGYTAFAEAYEIFWFQLSACLM